MEEDWIHTVSDNLVNRLNKYINQEGIELQKMILGMEILLINIPKLVLIFLLSVFLGILPQTFVTWFSFALIRKYAFGLHASKNSTCTVVSLLMFVAVPYLCAGIRLNGAALVCWLLCVCAALYKFAPADTAARPLVGAKKRAKLKKKSIAANLFLLLALVLRDETINTMVAVGTLYTVVVILPATYKILKRSEKNYEKYE